MAATISLYNRSLHKAIFQDHSKPYRLTPFIVTFCDASLTSIDIENFIEMGLRIIRFKMTKLSISDKIILLAKFKQAMKLFCEKYDVQTWPVAICIDLPNACIKTGCISEEIGELEIMLEDNSIIKITSNKKFWNKCSKDILYMDDPYTFVLIKPGIEVTIGCGKVIMICMEVIDEQNIKCKIVQGGFITNVEFFCVRGIKHTKPPLSKYDRKMIEFAKEYKLDIIIMNSVRRASTLDKVRSFFKNSHTPLIISTICEQEGLDNVDDIIEKSDGLILAREFLAYEILNKYQMNGIQMLLSAKCRQKGKPFFISGNILSESLKKGIITDRDVFDITNAAIDGTGFLLRESNEPANLLIAMNVLDSLCKSVESVKREINFWRILDEVKMPVNAAEAACLACALAAKQSDTKVIIVPTVSGDTPRRLTQVAPEAVILTVTSNSATARKLQLFRGIISIIFNVKTEKGFEEEINARVDTAVNYCITHNILKYKETYVLLRKANIYSAFPDSVSLCTVHTIIHAAIEC
ncbi:pyruvate kinase-like [Battus philenor]|uniref:pyruvate kinase-like n=1 Tax=Battus philenor TaxID=42288 RepID=UPI0035D0644F